MRQLYKEVSRPKWEHCETVNSSDQESIVAVFSTVWWCRILVIFNLISILVIILWDLCLLELKLGEQQQLSNFL